MTADELIDVLCALPLAQRCLPLIAHDMLDGYGDVVSLHLAALHNAETMTSRPCIYIKARELTTDEWVEPYPADMTTEAPVTSDECGHALGRRGGEPMSVTPDPSIEDIAQFVEGLREPFISQLMAVQSVAREIRSRFANVGLSDHVATLTDDQVASLMAAINREFGGQDKDENADALTALRMLQRLREAWAK